MINPWENVTWDVPYAKCDKKIIFQQKHTQLQIDGTLPEPYSGNVNSNVICLNGNPGRKDTKLCEDEVKKEIFGRIMKDTLNHSIRDFTWLTEEMKAIRPVGSGWWENMTKMISSEPNSTAHLFVLEYFPYHSTKMFNFPKLPSDKYRNFLLNKAMKEGKLILIMRARKLWESIQEDNLGENLKAYPNKIVLKNPQRVYLSRNNMGAENWEEFLKALRAPLKEDIIQDIQDLITYNMPKRRRHQPGVYKPKPELPPNFTGTKPLSLFQGDNGLWGAKSGDGIIELEPIYQRLEQTEEEKQRNEVRLASRDTVLSVTPDDWDIISWLSSEFFEKDD